LPVLTSLFAAPSSGDTTVRFSCAGGGWLWREAAELAVFEVWAVVSAQLLSSTSSQQEMDDYIMEHDSAMNDGKELMKGGGANEYVYS